MKRAYCPTGKLKHFNEAWADIAAERQTIEFGVKIRTYKCGCGWWHTYDRTKKHQKDQRNRGTRSARKRRARTGEPSPGQIRRQQEEQQRQEAKREKERLRKRNRQQRQRAQAWLALRTWEDDGGMCVWPRDN
jgi:hypothetical protein